MMCPAIDNPTSCEIRVVIHFLHSKDVDTAEISCELCEALYGQNITMSHVRFRYFR
jgi:hypothetical protein